MAEGQKNTDSGSKNQKSKILFDITLLVQNYNNPQGQTGIYRVNLELLKAFNESENVEVHYYKSKRDYSSCIKFLDDNNLDTKKLYVFNDNYQKVEKLEATRKNLKKAGGLLNKILVILLKPLFLTMKALGNKSQEKINDELEGFNFAFSGIFDFPKQLVANTNLELIYTAYDLIPIHNPEYFDCTKAEEHWLYHSLMNIPERAKVFCISESTKKDFLNFRKNFNQSQVFSGYLGASKNFYKCTNASKFSEIKEKYKLPEANEYILSLCTLEPRKNLKALIAAFAKFIEANPTSDLKLVLTGNKGWLFEDIVESELTKQLEGKVIFTGFIPDSDLASLYSNAKFFAYVSLYEGFGLPILEAMSCGCAVLASNTSSMPEVGGDAALYTDPQNLNEIYEKITLINTDADLRVNLKNKAQTQAQKFSWSKLAEEILAKS